ncbi:MAG: fluoride efflux transporter CrcB [Leptonema sp. (in: Bacteria)]|nr:fluoride efflux transporter CrcB [Leptonema sp. (in: bacteria)]
MNQFNAFVFVALGGLSGSYCRYLVSSVLSRFFSTAFPFGTFAVNILGCLLIGIFYGLSKEYSWFSNKVSLLLITGFCGGFTTFSSFAYENINLLQTNSYLYFALYSILSFSLGIIAVYGGLVLIKIIS